MFLGAMLEHERKVAIDIFVKNDLPNIIKT